MSLPVPAISVLLALLVIIAAIMDVKNRKIPNWLTVTSAVLGLGLNTFLFEWPGLRESLEGLGLAFVVYFLLYLLRGMGAGDVKLMAAVGATVGPVNWFGILVLTSAFAAICGLIVVVLKGRLRRTFQNLWFILVSLRHGQAPYKNHPDLDVRTDQGIRLPHAVMIAGGSLAFLAAALIWAPR